MKSKTYCNKQLKAAAVLILSIVLLFAVSACTGADSGNDPAQNVPPSAENVTNTDNASGAEKAPEKVDAPSINAGQRAAELSVYTDANGDAAYIPADFMVSSKADEQSIKTGLVVIGPDGSEFVWIPTTVTKLAVRDFGSYFSGGSISSYHDETELDSYKEMVASVEKYGGFYIGRYEASKGADGLPASKRVTQSEPGQIWVQFSPQDTTIACQDLYADNDTVQGFFPWGINWDTTLQWLVDSGCKQISDIRSDSTSWGNYSNDSFSEGARGNYTGAWEEAKANNIYDLAGNNWEWTQERCGSNYVMRSGGYNLMGGACPGSRYPAAIRDPLPGNDHHPNVTFRVALYVSNKVVAFPDANTRIVLADGNIQVTGSGAEASGNIVTIISGGTYIVTGRLTNGRIVIDAPKDEDVKLVLAGVEIMCSDSAGINCRKADDLIIELADGTENHISDGASYVLDNIEKEEPNAAIFSKCDLTFEGSGKLTIDAHYKHGIASKDDLCIREGSFIVNASSDAIRGKDSVTIEGGIFVLNSEKDGIAATNDEDPEKGWISIENGTFTIRSAGDAIQAETTLSIADGSFDIVTSGTPSGSSGSQKGIKSNTDILIENGTFRLDTADDSIHADRDMTINDGVYVISTKDDGIHSDRNLTINGGTYDIPSCYEGLESTVITVNGGTFTIRSDDDAIGAAAKTDEAESGRGANGNPNVKVYINGGEIEAVSGGDTIDSNGDIYVTGGKLRLSSPADPYYEGVLLCNGTVHISGGDIAMVGNVGVELTVENQPALFVSHSSMQKAGSIVSLKDADGKTILSVTSQKNFKQTIFSSPQLEIGKTYTVFIDGVRKTEVTLSGMINKTADDGGTFTGGYPRGHW